MRFRLRQDDLELATHGRESKKQILLKCLGWCEDRVMVQRKSTDAEERAICEKCPHDDSHLEQLFFLRAL